MLADEPRGRSARRRPRSGGGTAWRAPVRWRRPGDRPRQALSLEWCRGVEALLVVCAKTLDKHYIPTRYPNGLDAGAPTDFYTLLASSRK